MARRILAITLLVVGLTAMTVGAFLAFGPPIALFSAGIAVIAVSIVLGWN